MGNNSTKEREFIGCHYTSSSGWYCKKGFSSKEEVDNYFNNLKNSDNIDNSDKSQNGKHEDFITKIISTGKYDSGFMKEREIRKNLNTKITITK